MENIYLENQKLYFLDEVRAFTNATWIGKSERLARVKVGINEAMTDKEFPEENDVWSGSGTDFDSKNGEGSGLQSKIKNSLDYINGDDLLTLAGMFASFGVDGKGIPIPPSVKGKFSNAELEALSNIFEASKKLDEAIEEVLKVKENTIQAKKLIEKN